MSIIICKTPTYSEKLIGQKNDWFNVYNISVIVILLLIVLLIFHYCTKNIGKTKLL